MKSLAIAFRGILLVGRASSMLSSKFSLKKEKITIRRRKVHQD